ncbi:MAG: glutamyl-tRNA reductase [Chloroflexi bacterium]|nr:glutamyl-tRNA reductase [Chloroflexota bacterium]MBM3174196.1 glutamyl-tRNA reductase [Chloroflexota bacterium]MBM4450182.1 glutamyl-tRNA reductase [Chloroflexota bacterium]
MNARPNKMQINVVGVNHSTTPVEVREKLAVSNNQIANALLMLRKHVEQGMILSTCNRTEVYSIARTARTSVSKGMEFLRDWAKTSDAELLPYIYHYENEEAVRHLFHVAAGLDSMIIGEFEILGQVKQRLEDAEGAGMVKQPLRNLFHHALQVGRRVREKTGISKNALSVSSVAVSLAAQAIGDLSKCKALVIGTGEAGRLVAKALKEKGIWQITTTSRSQENASALATALGGHSINISNLSAELATHDIVISCTGAPHTILDRQTVEAATETRDSHPLVIIDIAVPRDVEPEVRQIKGIVLCDIDDLTHVSELNRKQREREIHSAMRIIDSEMKRFASWWQTTEAEPIISSLTNKAENIRRVQLDRTLKKLPNLSPKEQESLEAMTKAIVQKLLHNPIQCLKENANAKEDYINLVRELFQLDTKGHE